jgi:hypothetical protein
MDPSRDKPRRNIVGVGGVLKLRSKGGHWWEFLQELGKSWPGGIHVAVAGWMIRLRFGKRVEVSSVGVSQKCLDPKFTCVSLPVSLKSVW